MWCSAPLNVRCGPDLCLRSAATWTFFGADDGIRTLDPHLGKVIVFVHQVRANRLACSSIHLVSSESTQVPPVVERSATRNLGHPDFAYRCNQIRRPSRRGLLRQWPAEAIRDEDDSRTAFL